MTTATIVDRSTVLKSIELHQFGCFKSLTFDFSPQSGFYLITGVNKETPALGSNGLGKSTTFNALSYGLYGKTITGRKAGKLLNRTCKGGYSVTLNFTKNGEDFTIHRSWNPGVTILNGKEVEQSEIESFIGLTFEQFAFGILIGQNQPHFIDLTASEKLSFLSQTFQLDKWLKCSELAKEKLKTVSIAQNSKHSHLKLLQFNLEKTIEKANQLVIDEADWFDTHTTELSQIEVDVTNTRNEIASLAPVKVVSIFSPADTADLTAERTKLLQAKDSHTRHQGALTSGITNQKKGIERLLAQEGAECPTCFQVIGVEHIEKVALEMVEELDELEADLASTIKSLEAIAPQIAQIDKALENLREEQSQCQMIKVKEEADKKIRAEKQKRLEVLERALAQKTNEVNPYTKQLESLSVELENLELESTNLELEIKEIYKQVAHYEFWVKRFPQIRLLLLKEIVEELELHFNQAFSSLGLLDWEVAIETERELKNETTKAELTVKLIKGGQELEIDSLSGGEKQRIRIARALGISELIKARLGVFWPILLLDEPLSGLSAQGIDTVLELLNNISSNTAVYIAEHHSLQAASFTRVFELIKQPDGNSILA